MSAVIIPFPGPRAPEPDVAPEAASEAASDVATGVASGAAQGAIPGAVHAAVPTAPPAPASPPAAPVVPPVRGAAAQPGAGAVGTRRARAWSRLCGRTRVPAWRRELLGWLLDIPVVLFTQGVLEILTRGAGRWQYPIIGALWTLGAVTAYWWRGRSWAGRSMRARMLLTMPWDLPWGLVLHLAARTGITGLVGSVLFIGECVYGIGHDIRLHAWFGLGTFVAGTYLTVLRPLLCGPLLGYPYLPAWGHHRGLVAWVHRLETA